MSWMAVLLKCLAIGLLLTSTVLIPLPVRAWADSPYAIDGLSLHGQVRPNTKAYSTYKCEPSSFFPSYTWCRKREAGRYRDQDVAVSTSILHSSDFEARYISQGIAPLRYVKGEVQQLISQ